MWGVFSQARGSHLTYTYYRHQNVHFSKAEYSSACQKANAVVTKQSMACNSQKKVISFLRNRAMILGFQKKPFIMSGLPYTLTGTRHSDFTCWCSKEYRSNPLEETGGLSSI